MKRVNVFCFGFWIVLSIQAIAAGQSTDVNENLKIYFNEVAQEVEKSSDADQKREIINDSLERMRGMLGHVEMMDVVTAETKSGIQIFKKELMEIQYELNGEDGYERVEDEELDEFVDYVQQSMEQAVNRTITISVGTAILIVLLLILL